MLGLKIIHSTCTMLILHMSNVTIYITEKTDNIRQIYTYFWHLHFLHRASVYYCIHASLYCHTQVSIGTLGPGLKSQLVFQPAFCHLGKEQYLYKYPEFCSFFISTYASVILLFSILSHYKTLFNRFTVVFFCLLDICVSTLNAICFPRLHKAFI